MRLLKRGLCWSCLGGVQKLVGYDLGLFGHGLNWVVMVCVGFGIALGCVRVVLLRVQVGSHGSSRDP